MGGKRKMISEKERNQAMESLMPEQKTCGALREGWSIADDITEAEKLRSITFLDDISPQADGKWDVSEQRDGSVMA